MLIDDLFLRNLKVTIKPVHNDHISGPKKWPLLKSGRAIYVKKSSNGLQNGGHYRKVVAIRGLLLLAQV
jgi:hypothetical protein